MKPHRRMIVAATVLFPALLGLASCGGPGYRAAQESTAMLAIVDQYIAGWNAHDAAQAASFFADSVVYYDASLGTPQVGRANAQTNVIEAFLKAVPDAQWTRDDKPPVVGADGVAFTWTFSGTNTGPWGDGTKATNKKFTITGATIIRIADGKIIYQGDFYDTLGFYKQLGLM